MKKVLMLLVLVTVLLVSTFAFADEIQGPVDIDGIYPIFDQYTVNIIITAEPMDEYVMAKMRSGGWDFLSVIKYNKKFYWYFIRPAEMWLLNKEDGAVDTGELPVEMYPDWMKQ